MTTAGHQQSSTIQVEMQRSHADRDTTEIYNNFATPLVGKFLNLTEEPCLIQCPSCDVKAMSKVVMEMHRNSWRWIILTRIISCLCVCCCCCCDGDKNVSLPIMSEKANHYCSNCSCYFGQESRYHKIDI